MIPLRRAPAPKSCAFFNGLLGTAQDQKTAPPDSTAPKPHRALYPVTNGDAPLLAEVVGRHFKGEATVSAVPGNAILVSATVTAVPEVLKLLEQLDQKPQTIEVEVTLAEMPVKDWKDGEVNVAELGKTGLRFKLTAVEGLPVSTRTGGATPLLPSKEGGGKGGPRSVEYQDEGTALKLTARTGSGGTVVVDLSVQDSRVRHPQPGDAVMAPSMMEGSLTARVSGPAGQAVVAQAVRSEGKAGGKVAVIVVTARVVPDAPPPKRK